MTLNDKEYRDDLEYLIRQEVGHKADIGLHVFETNNGIVKDASNTFCYADCVAVAALILQGTNPLDAAALVWKRMAFCSPHFIVHGTECPSFKMPHERRFGGIYRLADGALWALNLDADFRHPTEGTLGRDYLIVATRGTCISDELIAARVKHMLTPCDDLGRPTLAKWGPRDALGDLGHPPTPAGGESAGVGKLACSKSFLEDEDHLDYSPFAAPDWEDSGLTASQISTLDSRWRAERSIRRAMAAIGNTAEEIEEFVTANLPPIGDVVREVFSRQGRGDLR